MSTISEILKQEKRIKNLYNLSYRPKLFFTKQDVEVYMEKIADKKAPIFFLKNKNVFIVTHQSDKQIMVDKKFTNLNSLQ